MNANLPLASLPTDQKDYVLNVYRYRNHLVGVIERTSLLQLFELAEFVKPANYIAWRFRLYWPSPLLDIDGMPATDKYLLKKLTAISTDFRIPIYGQYQAGSRNHYD